MSQMLPDAQSLTLKADDSRPKYQQIKDLVGQRIKDGRWRAGRRLPSESEWVEQLGVSRMTVNRALRELMQEGKVERVHGVGTFVAAPLAHASLIELRDIALEINDRGHRHDMRLIRLREEQAPRAIARELQLDAGAPVFRIIVLHLENDAPIQLEDRWVNPALAPDFTSKDFTQQTPTAYLLSLFAPDEMEHRVRAVLPDASTAKRLSLGRGEPCLQLTRRTWKNNAIVTLAVMTYPGSRYDLLARYTT